MTVTPSIWLIGGTRESRELAQVLALNHLPCTISVTTESARSLYPSVPLLQVWVGQLDADSLPDFLTFHQVVAILDASHPFATTISQLAIDTALKHDLPYLRYERKSVDSSHFANNQARNPDRLVRLPSFEALIQGDYLAGERVFLTTGYRTLHLFQPWQKRSHLYARVLPAVASLEAALAAGFTPDRIIGIRPPISLELERALWQHWQITLVVSKASGTPGGEPIKRQLATELGVKLILIDRPPVAYPHQTDDLTTAIAFCRTNCAGVGVIPITPPN
ncbi:cobalt-precorrin-6A reductase [Phormidium pseudopriestleyi FRX01]|uniref:Cobalt-precorrin-6A reductase n=1 Tax=Phormidium pseudopriestleyi FRX01 TaxID=1759528 RepID=A0ABS3FSX8_9CYAN|nr:cobalt-precorrin-6A reductase [Phormidium pseudopriestleyi]MBO0350220.1 cobalt-precorrin-6A reductase [Phormidium pseudopriestleyi FRX01]